VSHQSIYQAIYVQPKGALARSSPPACAAAGPGAGPKDAATSGPAGRASRTWSTSQSPAEAEDRAVPGHWEGDLIEGASAKSAIATLVEHTTRLGMLINLEEQKAEHVATRIAEHIVRLPEELARSLTWDQDSTDRSSPAVAERLQLPTSPQRPWGPSSGQPTVTNVMTEHT
jgi:IS30 family transposase